MTRTEPICDACGVGPLAPVQRFCRHCGRRIPVLERLAPLSLATDAFGTRDRSALPGQMVPIAWASDGRDVVMAHGDEHAPRFARLHVDDARLSAEALPVGAAGGLRAFTLTRRGVFVAAGRLRGALAPTAGNEHAFSPAPELIPANAAVVGLAPAASGEVFALTREGERLTLWGGSGGRALRRIATAGGGPQTECWMRLFVVCAEPGRGLARFWGGGRVGEVDLELGAMSIRADPRAPSEAVSLRERGHTHLLDHQANDLASNGIAPIPMTGGAGRWGLLHLATGERWAAPEGTDAPLALAASDTAVLCQKPGETLVVGAEPGRSNPSLQRIDLGLRIVDGAIAVARAGQGFVAFNTRESEANRVVVHQLTLAPGEPPILSAEHVLGGAATRAQCLPPLPPLIADGCLWLATVGRGGGAVDVWRAALV